MAERFTDLVDLFERSCAKFADRPFLGEKRAGSWAWTSYGEVRAKVEQARGGLARLGVGTQDVVAVIARNRPEWLIAVHAAYGLGATVVAMYPAQTAKDWVFALRDSGAKVAFVAKDCHDRLRDIENELPSLEKVVVFDDDGPDGFAELMREGTKTRISPRAPSPRDVASLVYTSGTRGFPKAVMQSHANVVANINAVHALFSFESTDVAVNCLPWSNAYGHTSELTTLMSMGVAIAINDRWDHLLETLQEIRPTVLFAAPQLLHFVHQMHERQPDLDLVAWLGGRVKFVASTGTTLDRGVAEALDALGVPIFEGYGMSEATIVSSNVPRARKLGSVGRPVPGVRVTIDKTIGDDEGDGEIIVSGPNVMLGYHERPEETAHVFTHRGALRTGDLGHIDEDGYLYVSGRLEELITLSNGRKISPAPIEEHLTLSPYIRNTVLWGDGRPFLVALVVVDTEAVDAWAANHEPANQERPNVDGLIRSEIERLSAGMHAYERPRAFVLTTERLSLKNGLLTPTMKVRRPGVIARHRLELERLYLPDSALEERGRHERCDDLASCTR